MCTLARETSEGKTPKSVLLRSETSALEKGFLDAYEDNETDNPKRCLKPSVSSQFIRETEGYLQCFEH